jgi:hypothetical protein
MSRTVGRQLAVRENCIFRFCWKDWSRDGRPRGMKVGSGVIVKRPHRISHSEFIHTGDNPLIHNNAPVESVRLEPYLMLQPASCE